MKGFTGFTDYDDANVIGAYNMLSVKEKMAVDRIFSYLCGGSFEQLINKYNEQH